MHGHVTLWGFRYFFDIEHDVLDGLIFYRGEVPAIHSHIQASFCIIVRDSAMAVSIEVPSTSEVGVPFQDGVMAENDFLGMG